MIDYAHPDWAFPKDSDFEEPTFKEKKAIRETVYYREDGKCSNCKRSLIKAVGYWWSAHLHHLRGGSHRKDWTPENLTILCIICHSKTHHGQIPRAKRVPRI